MDLLLAQDEPFDPFGADAAAPAPAGTADPAAEAAAEATQSEAAAAAADVTRAALDGDIDVDAIGRMTRGLQDLLRGLLEQLPQVLLALFVLLLFVLLSHVVKRVIRTALTRTTSRNASFVNVMSGLARGLTIFLGFLLALVVAIPSVNLASIIGLLGISSVAIGFAFRDILQNTLAGLLLLFRQPFEIGDQIEVSGHLGMVEAITIRETRLKTFDGQRILIPNSDVYTSSVRVQTAYRVMRTAISVGVDYEADFDRAQRIAVEAASKVEGVEADPPVEALFTELGSSTVNFDVRFWAASRQLDHRRVQDRVVRAVTTALNEADIDMPADIVELDARVSFADAVVRARERTDSR